MGFRVDRVEKMIKRELALILNDSAKNELLKSILYTFFHLSREIIKITLDEFPKYDNILML